MEFRHRPSSSLSQGSGFLPGTIKDRLSTCLTRSKSMKMACRSWILSGKISICTIKMLLSIRISRRHLTHWTREWIGRSGEEAYPTWIGAYIREATGYLGKNEMGPFLNKKIQFWQRNEATIKSNSRHWAPGINGDNFNLFRLGHVLLWRAEVAVEENDLATALTLVNQIRARAADDLVMGRVATINFGGITDESDIEIDDTQPAANYLLGQYPSFPDQDYARTAVRHEMRLEFALEGMRFFDLVRWGIDDEELNAYLQAEAGCGHGWSERDTTRHKMIMPPFHRHKLICRPELFGKILLMEGRKT